MKKTLFLMSVIFSVSIWAAEPSIVGTWDAMLMSNGGGGKGTFTFTKDGKFVSKFSTDVSRGSYEFDKKEYSILLSYDSGLKRKFVFKSVADDYVLFTAQGPGGLLYMRMYHSDPKSFAKQNSLTGKDLIKIVKRKKVDEVLKLLSDSPEIYFTNSKKRLKGEDAVKEIKLHLEKSLKEIKTLKVYSSNSVKMYSKVNDWEFRKTSFIFKVENNKIVITHIVVEIEKMG